MRCTRALAVTAAVFCGAFAFGAGPAVAAAAPEAVPATVADDPGPWPPGTGTGDDDSSTSGLDDDSVLDQFLAYYLDVDGALANALRG